MYMSCVYPILIWLDIQQYQEYNMMQNFKEFSQI